MMFLVATQVLSSIFFGITSPLPACHSGFGGEPGPVIEVRQHVVERSPVVQELFEHELLGHIRWVKKKLAEVTP